LSCLCFCIFVLSTPDSFSRLFRLRHPIAAWITASFAYGMRCALSPMILRLSSRAQRRLDLIGMNVMLALILAEIGLRIASVVWASPLLMTESTSSQIRRDSERMPLVVTIGDSFSYGVVPHYYHYTTVAEREIPSVEIYNIGFPGTNPVDYLYELIEEALPLEPDLVVIALYGGNDIVVEPPAAAPTGWYDAQRYMVSIVRHRLQILRRSQGIDWTQDSPKTIGEDLVSRYPWVTDPSQESPSMGEETFVELAVRNAYLGGATHPGVYERFFEALGKIADASGDVPLTFVTIPDEYQVSDALWEAVFGKNEIPLQRDLPQRRIRQWAHDGNRSIVDLLPLLLAEEPLADDDRHLYHLRYSHFNARGSAIAGWALAKLIEAKLSGGDIPDFAMQSPQDMSAAPQSAQSQGKISSDEANDILQPIAVVKHGYVVQQLLLRSEPRLVMPPMDSLLLQTSDPIRYQTRAACDRCLLSPCIFSGA
jgi:hypothetical protein